MGDVNNDGRVTIADAVMTLKATLNLMSLDERQTKAADVDLNNRITVADAIEIQKIALKVVTK